MTFPEPTGTPDTWLERIRPGAFTPPSGVTISFEFEDVSRETDLRRTPFQFPGVDGVYVQQSGVGARRYPLRCYFTGDNCDLEATAFEAALFETGVGTLAHPFYGTFPAVAMGTVGRLDRLVSGANQSIVDVVFWPTLRTVYPSDQNDADSEITTALEGFDVAQSQAYEVLMGLDTIGQQTGLKDSIRALVQTVSDMLGAVAAVTSSVNREFRDTAELINFGLDVFVGQPLQLAQQIYNLTTVPARSLAAIEARLEAYADYANRLFNSEAGQPGKRMETLAPYYPPYATQVANEYHTTDLGVGCAVAGSVVSAQETTFGFRADALAAAAAIFDQFDAWVAWRDLAFEDIAIAGLDQLDTGASVQALQEAVALTAGNLVQISFSLLPEKRIVLAKPRTIVDLAGQLYGAVDSRLDELIANNNLTGDEILELPAGKSIVYYPEVT